MTIRGGRRRNARVFFVCRIVTDFICGLILSSSVHIGAGTPVLWVAAAASGFRTIIRCELNISLLVAIEDERR